MNNILEIQSSTKELQKVAPFLKSFLRNNNLSSNNYNSIYLCISEAVVNAITHGNLNKVDKKITIELGFAAPYLSVKIVDEGCGFKLQDVPDPTKGSNLFKETGRGLHIIKSYSERLSVSECEISIFFKMLING